MKAGLFFVNKTRSKKLFSVSKLPDICADKRWPWSSDTFAYESSEQIACLKSYWIVKLTDLSFNFNQHHLIYIIFQMSGNTPNSAIASLICEMFCLTLFCLVSEITLTLFQSILSHDKCSSSTLYIYSCIATVSEYSFTRQWYIAHILPCNFRRQGF